MNKYQQGYSYQPKRESNILEGIFNLGLISIMVFTVIIISYICQ